MAMSSAHLPVIPGPPSATTTPSRTPGNRRVVEIQHSMSSASVGFEMYDPESLLMKSFSDEAPRNVQFMKTEYLCHKC